jgi:hypothetical protein
MTENELVADVYFAYGAGSEENGFWSKHVQAGQSETTASAP